MWYRVSAILLAGVAGLTFVSAAVPYPVAASTVTAGKTWSVTPGGAVSGHSSASFDLNDAQHGGVLVCPIGTWGGVLKPGAGLPGTGIGAVRSLTLHICAQLPHKPIISPQVKLPWTINFRSVTGGVVNGTITGVEIKLSSTKCSATAGGPGGTVAFQLTLSTQRLRVLTTGGNLRFSDVHGCRDLISNGDHATLSVTYTVTPKQDISSP
jgi:hypothetical protein